MNQARAYPTMMNLALRESVGAFVVPALFAPDAAAKRRTVEFFTAHIRNANTRKAYASASKDFARWCRGLGTCDLGSVQSVHVATYIEQLSLSAPSVKQRLAALRS